MNFIKFKNMPIFRYFYIEEAQRVVFIKLAHHDEAYEH